MPNAKRITPQTENNFSLNLELMRLAGYPKSQLDIYKFEYK